MAEYVAEEVEDLESNDLKVERMRRMKALARKLHEEGIEPKRKGFRPIQAKGAIFIFSMMAITVFAVSSLYNFNRFVKLEEEVLSAKGGIEASLQRRSNLFGNLVNVTLNHARLEEDIFSHVADVRTNLNTTNNLLSDLAKNPDALKAVSGGAQGAVPFATVESSLSKLLAIVEQYPDIKSSTTYQQLMDKLVEIEDRVITKRFEFNKMVQMYNSSISAFPWYFLAKTTGFSRYQYFQSREGVNSAPLVTPETFADLLPARKGKGGK